jgi:hypothetical protein
MPQRLWFKTNLKLCKIFFDMGEYGRMNKVSLYYWCVSWLLEYMICSYKIKFPAYGLFSHRYLRSFTNLAVEKMVQMIRRKAPNSWRFMQ